MTHICFVGLKSWIFFKCHPQNDAGLRVFNKLCRDEGWTGSLLHGDIRCRTIENFTNIEFFNLAGYFDSEWYKCYSWARDKIWTLKWSCRITQSALFRLDDNKIAQHFYRIILQVRHHMLSISHGSFIPLKMHLNRCKRCETWTEVGGG